MDETLPVWFPGLIACAGLLLIALGGVSAMGRLPRNYVAGIRTSVTLASDDAWLAAHKAAARHLIAAGVVMVLGAALLVAVRTSRDASVAVTLGVASAALLLTMQSVRVAHRAARGFARESSLRREPNR